VVEAVPRSSQWRLTDVLTMSDRAGRDTVSSLKTGLNALLTPEERVLVLIDHQPFQFANLNSHEPSMIVNNVIGLAKTAKAFGVPVILTTVVGRGAARLSKGSGCLSQH
jgi:hypothetical protein